MIQFRVYHMFVFSLFCKPILCFVLSCGIRVASMSSVDSIPFPNGVLILRCEYQSFLIIKIVFINPFLTGLLLFKWIRTFQHPQDPISAFSMVFVSSIPSCLCFSRPPSLVFFEDSDFLIKYQFYSCEGSSFLPFNVLIR